MKLEFDIA